MCIPAEGDGFRALLFRLKDIPDISQVLETKRHRLLWFGFSCQNQKKCRFVSIWRLPFVNTIRKCMSFRVEVLGTVCL